MFDALMCMRIWLHVDVKGFRLKAVHLDCTKWCQILHGWLWCRRIFNVFLYCSAACCRPLFGFFILCERMASICWGWSTLLDLSIFVESCCCGSEKYCTRHPLSVCHVLYAVWESVISTLWVYNPRTRTGTKFTSVVTWHNSWSRVEVRG